MLHDFEFVETFANVEISLLSCMHICARAKTKRAKFSRAYTMMDALSVTLAIISPSKWSVRFSLASVCQSIKRCENILTAQINFDISRGALCVMSEVYFYTNCR
jgi:hypothetical protein